jgi:Ca-activated chloride channel family protein
MNELDQPVEAKYSFPTDPDIIVSKLRIELGDREVEGKVMEKGKAQEKYDDAIAGGNAAVMVKEKEENHDLLEMMIGGINPE